MTAHVVDLPPQPKDNDLVVAPLVILNTKWVTSDNGPEFMVLVQWKGLLPKDTSWEPWAKLKEDYHLENKVLSDGHRDVMNQPTQAHITEIGKLQLDKEGTSTAQRIKRKTTRPQYLKDFVTNSDPGR